MITPGATGNIVSIHYGNSLELMVNPDNTVHADEDHHSAAFFALPPSSHNHNLRITTCSPWFIIYFNV